MFRALRSAARSRHSLIALTVSVAVGAAAEAVRADTTFDSGTTTISTGTDFGTNLYVGYSGTATMEVIVGGIATSTNGYVGYNAGSDGTVDVQGGTWANGSNLCVGYEGTGSLNVSGGYVSDPYGSVGYEAGSNGSVTVTGGTWATSNTLNIGDSGIGTLNVSGGYVSNRDGYVGVSGLGVGVATVTSGTWANIGILFVGFVGTGTLNVSGGYVSNGVGYLGYGNGRVGTANVTGGTWANSNNLYVGYQGTGTLNVSGSGVVTVGGTMSEGTAGTINVGSGGQLTADAVILSNATSFTGDPLGTGFGSITATSGLTYGGVLGLHFGKLYDEGSYNLFAFASLTPAGSFASLFSTGTGGGSVYDSISFSNNGSGLWAGMATNGQTVSFNQATGVLSFSAVPEPSALALGAVGVAGVWMAVRRRRRSGLARR